MMHFVFETVENGYKEKKRKKGKKENDDWIKQKSQFYIH